MFKLRPLVKTEFNIEGYPSPEFIDLVLKVKPEQVTLVPDAPGDLTSHEGWEVEPNMEFLTQIVDTLRDAGIRTSIFVGTDPDNIRAAARAGPTAWNFTPSPTPTCIPPIPRKPWLPS